MNYEDKDYLPTDHGTMTKDRDVLLSDNEKFDVKLKSFIDDITERKDEDQIPY